MISIDKIIFGDNQFFGINHMSQEKAQILSEKFFDLSSILNVYDIAISSGIKGIMLNSNDRAKEICQYFRSSKFQNINVIESYYPNFNQLSIYEKFYIKAEPSGCVSLAAVLAKKIDVTDKNVLVTISGGNVDDKNFHEYLKLAEDQK